MKRIIFLTIFFLLFIVFNAFADVTADSCSSTHVQTAINAASDGEVVTIPTGSCTWQVQVTMHKAITLQGSGTLETIITNSYHTNWNPSLYTNYGSGTRIIQNIKFLGMGDDDNSYNIRIDGSGEFIVTGNEFDDIRIAINIRLSESANYGVIDNNSFDVHSCGGEVIQVTGGGNSAWSQPDLDGTKYAVYVEDNTFTNATVACNSGHAIAGTQGARYVFRYNEVEEMDLDAHGYLPGDTWFYATRWFEIYGNTIAANPSQRSIYIRGGTGYVYDNTIISGEMTLQEQQIRRRTHANYQDDCCTSYPCPQQIGTGTKLYEYNNLNGVGGDVNFVLSNYADQCGNGQVMSTYVQDGRDYEQNTEKPNYTPYTYPHPLSGVGEPVDKTISIDTDVDATCKYDESDVAYDSMANTFSTTGGTSHSQVLTLDCGNDYTYYARCTDGVYTNDSSTVISFDIWGATAPEISNPIPDSTLSCDAGDPRNVTLGIDTNIDADCKYDLNDVAYSSMANTFSTTGGMSHSQIVNLNCDAAYTIYTRCEAAGYVNDSSTAIVFDIDPSPTGDTTPPAISNPLPATEQACTEDPLNLIISVETNDGSPPVTCRACLDGVSGCSSQTAYADMLTNGGFEFDVNNYPNHNHEVGNLACGESFTYQVRCIDNEDNENVSSTQLPFSIMEGTPGQSHGSGGSGVSMGNM